MTTLLEDESLQVTGMIDICDYDKFGYTQMISIADLKDFFTIITSANLLRQKKIVVTNLNYIVSPIISIWKLFMSKKLKKRFQTTRNGKDVTKFIQPTSILPIEYGGDHKSTKDMIDYTIEIFKKHFNEVYDILTLETNYMKSQ